MDFLRKNTEDKVCVSMVNCVCWITAYHAIEHNENEKRSGHLPWLTVCDCKNAWKD